MTLCAAAQSPHLFTVGAPGSARLQVALEDLPFEDTMGLLSDLGGPPEV